MEKGYSQAAKHKFTYEWEINEITSFIKSSKYINKTDASRIESPHFLTGSKIGDSWYMALKIPKEEKNDDNSSSEKKKQWAQIFLMPLTRKKIRTMYSFSILNDQREKKFIQTFNYTFDGNLSGWGNNKFLNIEKILGDDNDDYDEEEGYLSNDTLTIYLELTVYDEYQSFNKQIPFKAQKRTISDDFKDLFDDRVGSNVVIIADKKKIHAHRGVLIARSPVFAAMFKHQMTENKKRQITISDIDPDVIEKMLEFMYTDEVTDIDAHAKDLLEVSDKYQIQSLIELCEESLCKSVVVDNAVKIMILADRHNAQELLTYVTDFIATNASEVIETEDYKNIETSNPSLLSLLVKKFAVYNNNTSAGKQSTIKSIP